MQREPLGRFGHPCTHVSYHHAAPLVYSVFKGLNFVIQVAGFCIKVSLFPLPVHIRQRSTRKGRRVIDELVFSPRGINVQLSNATRATRQVWTSLYSRVVPPCSSFGVLCFQGFELRHTGRWLLHKSLPFPFACTHTPTFHAQGKKGNR